MIALFLNYWNVLLFSFDSTHWKSSFILSNDQQCAILSCTTVIIVGDCDLRSESHLWATQCDKLPLMLSHFPSTFATKIILLPSLRSQVLARLPVKLVLYGKNCHVPCAIEDAAICPSDLSWRVGNFFRAVREAALPAFCPAVSGWLPADRFEGESRMSCRVDETRSRMEHTLENRRPLRQHTRAVRFPAPRTTHLPLLHSGLIYTGDVEIACS